MPPRAKAQRARSSASPPIRIETFELTESFNPARPYKTRLKWRDLAGGEQSKLLLTTPEIVIAELHGVKEELAKATKLPARCPARGRTGSRRMEGFRTQSPTGPLTK